MKYGICINGNGDVMTGKVYKLNDYKPGLYNILCDNGISGGVYKHRFQIIPKEVLESDLFKVIYGGVE